MAGGLSIKKVIPVSYTHLDVYKRQGRGYVLKRLLRRAARHGKLLGIQGKFLGDVVRTVIEENYVSYPELKETEDYILRIIETEEERFYATIDQGLDILKQYIEEAKASGGVLSGEKAFRLYDTYGFPIDLTEEITDEAGISAVSYTHLS